VTQFVVYLKKTAMHNYIPNLHKMTTNACTRIEDMDVLYTVLKWEYRVGNTMEVGEENVPTLVCWGKNGNVEYLANFYNTNKNRRYRLSDVHFSCIVVDQNTFCVSYLLKKDTTFTQVQRNQFKLLINFLTSANQKGFLKTWSLDLFNIVKSKNVEVANCSL